MVKYDQAVAALERQMAELSLHDITRKSQRMPLPPLQLVKDFDILATQITGTDQLTRQYPKQSVMHPNLCCSMRARALASGRMIHQHMLLPSLTTLVKALSASST